MIIRRIIFASVFFVAVGPAMATGNEIDGFRLGMTIEQAMKVAAEKGYSFRKVIPSSSPNWASYTLSNDGPAINRQKWLISQGYSAISLSVIRLLQQYLHFSDMARCPSFGRC